MWSPRGKYTKNKINSWKLGAPLGYARARQGSAKEAQKDSLKPSGPSVHLIIPRIIF